MVRGGAVAEELELSEGNHFRNLVARVRDRDEAAAAELVRLYEGAIRRVVRIHLRDKQMRRVLDSMDVCQSVLASFFVRTVLGQYELETPEELLNLLTSIARNKVANQCNRLRARRRDIRRGFSLAHSAEGASDPSDDPSEQASAREILERVRDRFDQEERYLADQRAMGRGWREITEELGGSAEALRKKLTRAVDRVMAELRLNEVAHE
jgi:RNA polymerase sigma factor (sigma-70 family)